MLHIQTLEQWFQTAINFYHTSDLVYVLQGQTQGLLSGTLGGLDGVEGSQQGLAGKFLL